MKVHAPSFRSLVWLSGVAVSMALVLGTLGCSTSQPSVPLAQSEWRNGLNLVLGTPAQNSLPDGAVALAQPGWVLLPAVSSAQAAVDMLIPIPFVVDGVMSQVAKSQGQHIAGAVSGVQPAAVLAASMEQRGALAESPQGLRTQVFGFIQECSDDRYRFALVALVSDGNWSGRYMVHLPMSVPIDRMSDADTRANLQAALPAASATLAELLEKAAAGRLSQALATVDVGSLHLVGSKSGGMVSPTLMVARNAQLIEDGPSQVVVRMAGDMTKATGDGGLFYGVHVLPKADVHTLTFHSPARPAGL